VSSFHDDSRPHPDEESRGLGFLISLLIVILSFVTPWALIKNAQLVAKVSKPAVISAENNKPQVFLKLVQPNN